MATQTNGFRQKNSTSAFCGPRAQLAVGGGISSTYRLQGTLPWPAPLGVYRVLSDFPVVLPLLVLPRDDYLSSENPVLLCEL